MRNGWIEPDFVNAKRAQGTCMEEYAFLFGETRIPQVSHGIVAACHRGGTHCPARRVLPPAQPTLVEEKGEEEERQTDRQKQSQSQREGGRG